MYNWGYSQNCTFLLKLRKMNTGGFSKNYGELKMNLKEFYINFFPKITMHDFLFLDAESKNVINFYCFS